MFPNVQLLLSTNYLLLAFFIPHFWSASDKTDMTQVQEVGLALLKANKDYAIQSSMEFDLEKVVGVHQYIYIYTIGSCPHKFVQGKPYNLYVRKLR